MNYWIMLKAMKKMILAVHWTTQALIVLKKNLENDLVQDEKSNNVLIVEANIQLAENTDVNDEENNVKLEQELTKKGKKGKVKENANKKDLKFKLG